MEKEYELPTNCLFFADDGNLHTSSVEVVQKLLDFCHNWSLEFEMTFAPENLVVIAKDELKLRLGDARLPQVKSCRYLGIPFTYRGSDWNSAAKDMTTKAKAVIMALARYGFNKSDWCPSAKIDVCKLSSEVNWNMVCRLTCTVQAISRCLKRLNNSPCE